MVDLADTTMSLDFSAPGDDVWTLVEKAATVAAKRAQKKAEAGQQEK